MSVSRDRIIAGSQSVYIDGIQADHVQSIGSTTTFNTEDIFNLGRLGVIDVVDDIPAVAGTIDTFEVNGIETVQRLARVYSATNHLQDATSASGFKGVALADFIVSNPGGFSMWAPTQAESEIGDETDNTIDYTMYMGDCFINNIELSYAVGANAQENYDFETDNKVWLQNSGKYVSQVMYTGLNFAGSGWIGILPTGQTVMGDASKPGTVLRGSKNGFLLKNSNLASAIEVYDVSAAKYVKIPIVSGASGTAKSTTTAAFWKADNGITYVELPSGTVTDGSDTYNAASIADNDEFRMIFAATAYSSSGSLRTGHNEYFDELLVSGAKGAQRQGGIEIFLFDTQSSPATNPDTRLQSVTITADLTREALQQLGNLRAYSRVSTPPIPVTITMESLQDNLSALAKIAGKTTQFNADTLVDTDIFDILAKKTFCMAVYVYHQSDEDAGGNHASRTWKSATTVHDALGNTYTYTAGAREFPQKIVLVKGLTPTEEAYSLAVGSNATQGLTFRASTNLFFIDTRNLSAANFAILESVLWNITKA